MEIEERIDIAAPPERVWSVISEVERWPEWTPTMQQVQRLDDGPFAIGSRARIRQPRGPVAIWTVIVLEAGRYFEWHSATPGLRQVAGHRVEPIASRGSRVTLSFNWSGPLAPIVRLFFGKLARSYVQTEAQSLKRHCEAALDAV